MAFEPDAIPTRVLVRRVGTAKPAVGSKKARNSSSVRRNDYAAPVDALAGTERSFAVLTERRVFFWCTERRAKNEQP